jgi:transposase
LQVGTLKAMPTTASLATTLIPNTADLELEDVTLGAAEVTATLLATRSEAPCPLCGHLSGRMHSRYQRTLADLPWSQHRVRLLLTVRKFFCDSDTCAAHLHRALAWGRCAICTAYHAPSGHSAPAGLCVGR